MTTIRRHPLVTFFVLAYAISWIAGYWENRIEGTMQPLWLAFFVMYGPAVAAIIVLTLTEGRPGLTSLARRLGRWHVSWYWYLIALGLPALLNYLAVALHNVLPHTSPVSTGNPLDRRVLLFPLYVLGEEIGWRGYALPQLLRRRQAFTASVILGALWALWHLPTFYLPGNFQVGRPFLLYALVVTAQAVPYTWMYNRTRGSLLLAVLLHAASNAAAIIPAAIEPLPQSRMLITVYGLTLCLMILILGLDLRTPESHKEKRRRARVRRLRDVKAAPAGRETSTATPGDEE